MDILRVFTYYTNLFAISWSILYVLKLWVSQKVGRQAARYIIVSTWTRWHRHLISAAEKAG